MGLEGERIQESSKKDKKIGIMEGEEVQAKTPKQGYYNTRGSITIGLATII